MDDLEFVADYLEHCPSLDWLAGHLEAMTIDSNGRVFLFGNGGGHATAAHWATDLQKATSGQMDVRAPAESATLLSMTMNDYGEAKAYRQMMPPIGVHDTVIVFSASARSLDIIELVDAARQECTVVGFFGAATALAERCDHAVARAIPVEDAENAWTVYGHRLSRELKERWETGVPSSSTSTES